MKRLIPLLLVLALVAVACGGSSPVGKWYYEDGDMRYLELTSDGNAFMVQDDFSMPFGTWEESGGKIELTMMGMLIAEGEIQGNELTLRYTNDPDPSRREVFTRRP